MVCARAVACDGAAKVAREDLRVHLRRGLSLISANEREDLLQETTNV